MQAFYLIDKPIWITSFDVLRQLKKSLWIKKMWHTGTLDPLATGLLLVAVWNYTKLIPYFEKDIKEYEFKVSLDGTTPSFDNETEITFLWEEKKKYFNEYLSQQKIQTLLQEKFTGKISQIPPKYSAIKIWWKKALDMVRNWQDFEMRSREAMIYNIEILWFSYPELHLKAKVSAGTYIRSIASDIWGMLWTWGYVTFLRRTEIGKLSLELSQKLDNFRWEKKLSEEKLFGNDRFIQFSQDIIEALDHGKIIQHEDLNLDHKKEYFVKNAENISHIIQYDGLYIKPIRKI